MTLQLQVRQVLADLGFGRFDENQPRDPDGKWSGGVPDVDLPDLDFGEDDEDEDDGPGTPDEDPLDNDRFPAAYREQYGDVVEETSLGNGNLFLAKTDKGGFHIARGEADREVLQELTDDTAGRLADMADLFVQAKPSADMSFKVPGTDIGISPADDGGIHLAWSDGTSTHFSPEDVDLLTDALLAMGPGYEED